MIKKKTGVVFTPAEYRTLEQCTHCLKASPIEYGKMCEECSKVDFKYCEVCEKVLRGGLHRFYSYDNRDNHRETEIEFLASKEKIREFVFEEMLPTLHPDQTICNDCVGFEKRMSDICFWCDNDFYNNVENYKLNGNTCEECVARFQAQGLNNDKEIRHN